jgi:hypothetical protein
MDRETRENLENKLQGIDSEQVRHILENTNGNFAYKGGIMFIRPNTARITERYINLEVYLDTLPQYAPSVCDEDQPSIMVCWSPELGKWIILDGNTRGSAAHTNRRPLIPVVIVVNPDQEKYKRAVLCAQKMGSVGLRYSRDRDPALDFLSPNDYRNQ